jgi:hypothetical protein
MRHLVHLLVACLIVGAGPKAGTPKPKPVPPKPTPKPAPKPKPAPPKPTPKPAPPKPKAKPSQPKPIGKRVTVPNIPVGTINKMGSGYEVEANGFPLHLTFKADQWGVLKNLQTCLYGDRIWIEGTAEKAKGPDHYFKDCIILTIARVSGLDGNRNPIFKVVYQKK